jgi:hypothetical protein
LRFTGTRLIPRDTPSRLLLTGPKMISSNKNVAMIEKSGANIEIF